MSDWLRGVAAEGGDVAPGHEVDPEIPIHLLWVWQAFWELTNDRPLGFGGVGGIPFTAIDVYARRYGIGCLDEFTRFRALIRALDDEYVKTVNKPKGKGAQ